MFNEKTNRDKQFKMKSELQFQIYFFFFFSLLNEIE